MAQPRAADPAGQSCVCRRSSRRPRPGRFLPFPEWWCSTRRPVLSRRCHGILSLAPEGLRRPILTRWCHGIHSLSILILQVVPAILYGIFLSSLLSALQAYFHQIGTWALAIEAAAGGSLERATLLLFRLWLGHMVIKVVELVESTCVYSASSGLLVSSVLQFVRSFSSSFVLPFFFGSSSVLLQFFFFSSSSVLRLPFFLRSSSDLLRSSSVLLRSSSVLPQFFFQFFVFRSSSSVRGRSSSPLTGAPSNEWSRRGARSSFALGGSPMATSVAAGATLVDESSPRATRNGRSTNPPRAATCDGCVAQVRAPRAGDVRPERTARRALGDDPAGLRVLRQDAERRAAGASSGCIGTSWNVNLNDVRGAAGTSSRVRFLFPKEFAKRWERGGGRPGKQR